MTRAAAAGSLGLARRGARSPCRKSSAVKAPRSSCLTRLRRIAARFFFVAVAAAAPDLHWYGRSGSKI